jgi:hypothetical protein
LLSHFSPYSWGNMLFDLTFILLVAVFLVFVPVLTVCVWSPLENFTFLRKVDSQNFIIFF